MFPAHPKSLPLQNRVRSRPGTRPTVPAAALPDGTMILQDDAPHLILDGRALPWSLGGYGAPVAAQDHARLITPPSTVAVLKAGYRPGIHASAFTERDPRHAV